jgi:hypothetical protein
MSETPKKPSLREFAEQVWPGQMLPWQKSILDAIEKLDAGEITRLRLDLREGGKRRSSAKCV